MNRRQPETHPSPPKTERAYDENARKGRQQRGEEGSNAAMRWSTRHIAHEFLCLILATAAAA